MALCRYSSIVFTVSGLTPGNFEEVCVDFPISDMPSALELTLSRGGSRVRAFRIGYLDISLQAPHRHATVIEQVFVKRDTALMAR
jgi:hypothetical protein